ncbi:MAG: hypothetical protein GC155_11015 [Alphaproteobacteria bacterium]|nr:hypothetical protein [Alphaproteobacteria bacterium]
MSLNLTRRLATLAIVTIGLAGAAFADTVKGLDGRWEGEVDMGLGTARGILTVTTGASGTVATMRSPDQSPAEIPVSALKRTGNDVSFEVPSVSASWKGKLSADGKTLDGNLTQNGVDLPLAMKLAPPGAPPIDARATIKGVDGVWRGELDSGGSPIHIIVTVATDKSGTSAMLASPDQGDFTLQGRDLKRDGQKISVAFSAISGAFSGALSADGATLDGTWSQAGTDLPLKLARGK